MTTAIFGLGKNGSALALGVEALGVPLKRRPKAGPQSSDLRDSTRADRGRAAGAGADEGSGASVGSRTRGQPIEPAAHGHRRRALPGLGCRHHRLGGEHRLLGCARRRNAGGVAW